MIDHTAFFASVRNDPFGGRLKQSQVDGLNVFLYEWEVSELTDLRWLAYMFGTVFHETAHTMQPIEEYGLGEGHEYGEPDPETGKTYYGRGYVQLTWKDNYERMGKIVGEDLVHLPELALVPSIAVEIMFEGMTQGLFTGKKLSDYFKWQTDEINARRIVNGTDKASTIAGYARAFYAALT